MFVCLFVCLFNRSVRADTRTDYVGPEEGTKLKQKPEGEWGTGDAAHVDNVYIHEFGFSKDLQFNGEYTKQNYVPQYHCVALQLHFVNTNKTKTHKKEGSVLGKNYLKIQHLFAHWFDANA